MKQLFLVLIFFKLAIFSFAQSFQKDISKPPIDTSVLGKWPELADRSISNNGKYISYVVHEYLPVNQSYTVLKASDGKWEHKLNGITNVKFTSDSRQAIYIKDRDSLCSLTLGSHQPYHVLAITNSFQLQEHTKGEWIVYQEGKGNSELIIRDVSTKEERRFSFVEQYVFSRDGRQMILQIKDSDQKKNMLEWVILPKGERFRIWAGEAKIKQILVNDSGTQLAFSTESRKIQTIWYYKAGNGQAIPLISDDDPRISVGLDLGRLDRFSKDGSRIFFNLLRREIVVKANSGAIGVSIWDYRDPKLQSEQLYKLKVKKEINSKYCSVLIINTRRVIQLQQKHENLYCANDDYCLIQSPEIEMKYEQAPSWYPAYKSPTTLFLVSTRDGNRRRLTWYSDSWNAKFSPGGKYIIYWHRPTLHYFTYEVATGLSRNITEGISADLTYNDHYYNKPDEFKGLLPVGGWIKDDAGVLIYDQHDIWLVDPLAQNKPQNITNGFGNLHDIEFRLAEDKFDDFNLNDKLLLAAYNNRTKENGHYYKVLNESGDPCYINMEPVWFSFYVYTSGSIKEVSKLKKAKNANVYLMPRETATTFPNYYCTSDLKTFKQVSDLHPEKKWNWMTSELHSWISSEGDMLQGVLYKPENFDPKKKYPVLISYYRQFSYQLNRYQTPNWIDSRIDNAWFVSNGYIVFTPDVHYRVPYLKESVVNSIASAAQYITTLPFVDPQRMGIQGHSFGGLETGYLVTNTGIFAAACSAAGSFNLINDAETIMPDGEARSYSEGDFIYGTKWDKLDLYIRNSPIFDVSKVRTPLLIMAGEKDNNKPFNQNPEFFQALRKSNKQAWMLAYENDGHVLSSQSARDFTVRVMQFFDHYLKKAPAPIWITNGIPARLKDVVTGYDLDPSGNCGKDCKVCKMWNEKWAKDSVATKKEIEEKTKSEHWMGSGN